jgi:26S proteasome regulatory subunit N2
MALQIAFDLALSATQEFLQKVQSHLQESTSSNLNQNSHDETLDASHESPKDIVQLSQILSGEITIAMNLDFLFRNNKTDIIILNKIRDSLEARNSIFHSAVTFSNAYMHAGTTVDSFIRDNLEWLS